VVVCIGIGCIHEALQVGSWEKNLVENIVNIVHTKGLVIDTLTTCNLASLLLTQKAFSMCPQSR
jgi:hypothetical protein